MTTSLGLKVLGTVLAFTGPCIICQLVAIAASMFTIQELLIKLRDPTAVQLQRNGYMCSIKIFLTNIGSFLFLCFYFAMITIAYQLTERTLTDCILYFMYSNVSPVFLSVFNPTVFVIFTPKTFKAVGPGAPSRLHSIRERASQGYVYHNNSRKEQGERTELRIVRYVAEKMTSIPLTVVGKKTSISTTVVGNKAAKKQSDC